MIETLRHTVQVFIPRGRRAKWVGLICLALLVAAAETVTAYLIFQVLELATDSERSELAVELPFGTDLDLIPLLVIAGIAFVLRGALATLAIYAQSRVVQNSGAAVSSLVHRRYLQAPYRFHLTRSSAESVRTVLWSVDQATQNALNPLVNVVTQILVSGMLLGLLIAIAPVLSISAIVVLAGGLGLVLAFVQPRLGRLGKLSETTVQHLLVSVRDSFDSVRDIKAYRAETYFDFRFKRHRRVLADLRTRRAVLDLIPGTALEFMVVLGLLVLIGLAQNTDSLTAVVPTLGAFGYAALRIIPSLNKIVSAANRLKYGRQAVQNVVNDLESAIPAKARDEDAAAAPEVLFTDTIELSGVTFSYPEAEAPALDNVDLGIRRGEMLAIAGGSGSGKSTLADIVLGLLEPDSGSIVIDGSDAVPAEWHRRVGIVSQTVVLLDGTVRDNVAFGAGTKADDDLVIQSLERAQLGDWLRSLPAGLDTMVGESGKLISGGERQRVAIARALYRRPALLILDEATSALDGATEAAVINALAHLTGELTTIIVSHRLAPLQAAHRVVMMEGGRITAVGSYPDLSTSVPEFRNLVGG